MLTTNQVPFIAQVSVIPYSSLWKCQVFAKHHEEEKHK